MKPVEILLGIYSQSLFHQPDQPFGRILQDLTMIHVADRHHWNIDVGPLRPVKSLLPATGKVQNDLTSIQRGGRPTHASIATLLGLPIENLRQLAVILGSLKYKNIGSVVVGTIEGLSANQVFVGEIPGVGTAEFEIGEHKAARIQEVWPNLSVALKHSPQETAPLGGKRRAKCGGSQGNEML